jgi:L-seryl-tRNA(Ser) seleniumtransferase
MSVNNVSVLVVESDDILRAIYSRLVAAQAKEVLTATNGHEGFQVYKAKKPDIIITDIKLPVINGIDMIKKNPLNRAVRIDKMTLAALEATLRLYLDPEAARREVPTVRMITEKPENLKKQAQALARTLRRELGESAKIGVREGVSRVGGGAFPEQDLKTYLVTTVPKANVTVEELKERLLKTEPPLVGRIEEEAFCLDPRTLTREEHKLCAEALSQVLI